jgi:hypothetical protein
MRSVFLGARAVVLLLVVLLIRVPAAYGDDPPSPFDPPEARIKIPPGVASDSRINPPSGDPTADARIRIPPGDPADDARNGDPNFFELLVDWLQTQARIGPPIG